MTHADRLITLGKIQDKLGRNGSFPLDPAVVAQPRSGRSDFSNFGPRVGVAWDPQKNGVMNLHAAYGMFYDNMRTLQNFGELTWPQAVIINRPAFPDPYQGVSRNAFVSTAPPNISVMFECDGESVRAPDQHRHQPDRDATVRGHAVEAGRIRVEVEVLGRR